MLRLNMVDILNSAQKVCTSWRRVSKEPSLWRKIDMRNLGYDWSTIGVYDFLMFCREAVDRSEGCLVEIIFGSTCDDSLLNYVADRSINLRRLALDMFPIKSNEVLLEKSVAKLPLLEELEVTGVLILDLKAIGHSCPRLKTLKLSWIVNMCVLGPSDDAALAIAENMTELRHLELRGNNLTDTGLTAILDNCPHLDHLDLQQCFNVELAGNLEKRCSEMIKDFRRTNLYPHNTFSGEESDSEDDYDLYGYDDYEDDYDPHRRSI